MDLTWAFRQCKVKAIRFSHFVAWEDSGTKLPQKKKEELSGQKKDKPELFMRTPSELGGGTRK